MGQDLVIHCGILLSCISADFLLGHRAPSDANDSSPLSLFLNTGAQEEELEGEEVRSERRPGLPALL